MDKEKPVYLAISRKAFNDGIDKTRGGIDRPFNAPRSENDYFVIAVSPKKGWDTLPILECLPEADRRIMKYFITLKIPMISHDPNFVVALNMTRQEFELCKKVGDVRTVDDINDLVSSYHAIVAKQLLTTAKKDKLLPLDKIEKRVASFREEWQKNHKELPVIGFTSGAFDIPHANHTRFLEAARKECDLLVVAIASDRTVREQKGEDRPYVAEQERAAHIAGISDVDAVVISDETYHENLLSQISPNIMFKGDDYKGKVIIGVPENCTVKIIEVGNSLHSSTIVDAIRHRNSPNGQGIS